MVTSEQLTTNRREEALAQDPWATPGPFAERAARQALKAQVGRLERELSAIVADGFPHIAPASDGLAPARRGVAHGLSVRAPGGLPPGPHLLTLAELERLRDRLATRVRRLGADAGARCVRAPRARAAGTDAGDAGALQVRAPAGRRPRGTRLRSLGGAPASRPDRDARRVVAAQALLRLSLSQGAARARGPGFAHLPSSTGSRSRRPTDSIVASVRRWRSVIDPTVLVSDIGTSARNLRARLSPQRR